MPTLRSHVTPGTGARPDASTLPRIRAEREQGDLTPYLIIERLGEFAARGVMAGIRVVRLDSRRVLDFVPPRVAATLIAEAYACALANDQSRRPSLRLPRIARAASARPTEAVRLR